MRHADGVAAVSGLDVPSVDVSRLSKLRSNGRCPEEARVGTDLRRAVKPKKMHEIVRLSDLTDQIGRLS